MSDLVENPEDRFSQNEAHIGRDTLSGSPNFFNWAILLYIITVLPDCYGNFCGNGWLSFHDSCYLFSNGASLHFTEAEVYLACFSRPGFIKPKAAASTQSDDLIVYQKLCRPSVRQSICPSLIHKFRRFSSNKPLSH